MQINLYMGLALFSFYAMLLWVGWNFEAWIALNIFFFFFGALVFEGKNWLTWLLVFSSSVPHVLLSMDASKEIGYKYFLVLYFFSGLIGFIFGLLFKNALNLISNR